MFSSQFDIITVYKKIEEKSKSIPRSHDNAIHSKPRDKNYRIISRLENLLQSKELVKEGGKKREKRKYLLPLYHKPSHALGIFTAKEWLKGDMKLRNM